MKLIMVLIAAMPILANADTWTMTNGVPITGTVISSQVACVWIKTPLGAVRQIPVNAFVVESCTNLPQDAAGIYVGYDQVLKSAKTAWKRILESSQEDAKSCDADIKRLLEMKSLADTAANQARLMEAEIKAWRVANGMRDATPAQRQAFVDKKIGEVSE